MHPEPGPPGRGEITLLGRDSLREERAASLRGRGAGRVLFHDALRPRDLERILAPVYPSWDNGLYRDYLDKFRLPGKSLVKTFSRGMKMEASPWPPPWPTGPSF